MLSLGHKGSPQYQVCMSMQGRNVNIREGYGAWQAYGVTPTPEPKPSAFRNAVETPPDLEK